MSILLQYGHVRAVKIIVAIINVVGIAKYHWSFKPQLFHSADFLLLLLLLLLLFLLFLDYFFILFF